MTESRSDIISNILAGIIVFFLVLAPILLFCSFSSVPNGTIGIVTLFGKIENTTITPGAHFLNPFSVVHPLNIKILTTSVESEAASKDLQTVWTTIVVNYNLTAVNPKKFYYEFGSDEDYLTKSIVAPAIAETFKSVVAQFTAEDLINKRSDVSAEIVRVLSDKLKEYSFNVDSINITNFKFSESFNQAIEAKVTAQQSVLTAQNNLQRIRVEAQQKVVEAKANAESMNLQKQIVTPELIQLKNIDNERMAIEKWDGKLPQYTSNNLPFIMSK